MPLPAQRAEIIATPRLRLCTALNEDFPPLFERVLADREVMQHVFAGIPLSLEAGSAFFQDSFDHAGTGRGLGVVIERSSSKVIGFAGLIPCRVLDEDDLELGFVFAKRAWGQGYAQEIGRAQLAFGFTTLQRSRLLAQVSPDNTASIAALTKIGMRLHATVDAPGRGRRQVFIALA